MDLQVLGYIDSFPNKLFLDISQQLSAGKI
jgi:hypothetical protein